MKRIASLDGLRAVSISLVIFWHFNTVAIPGLWRIDYGNLGVRVFFVISGFLITSLLLSEESDLRTFYTRRIARIMPAYWVYIAVVALLIPRVAASYRDVPTALLYLSNYVTTGLALGATWSLAVEEQFYLMWPWVMRNRSRALRVCVGVMMAAPVFRILSDYGYWPTNPRYAFEGVADALAAGCFLALARVRGMKRWHMLGVPAVLVLLALQPEPWVKDLLLSALNAAIAVFMLAAIEFRPAILNNRPVIWVGTLSYSLYLWQQLWMNEKSFTLKLSGALACACASYYLVERPARRFLNVRLGSLFR